MSYEIPLSWDYIFVELAAQHMVGMPHYSGGFRSTTEIWAASSYQVEPESYGTGKEATEQGMMKDSVTGDFVLPMNPGLETLPEQGEGVLAGSDDVIKFASGTALPAQIFHWRLPIPKNYTISPEGQPNSLMVRSSRYNLTSFDGDSTCGLGQTFVARRQAHSRFLFRVDVEYDGPVTQEENKVGITAPQGQSQNFDIGVVMLKTNSSSSEAGSVQPHIQFRGISETTYRLPSRFKYVDEIFPLPEHLCHGQKLCLQVEAVKTTHYAFSAGLGGMEGETEMTKYGYTRGNYLIPFYSDVVVGPYATSNGKVGEGAFKTYISRSPGDIRGWSKSGSYPRINSPCVGTEG
ncbi:hypothetical protein D0866_11617 [Hortaea werneckii]|uniref:Uncharacterized protein n=1 Tax=Hortaea werneckii TaxID=91943 RepID=A0A3M7A843_HORWE|nr:hypothetical protein D0866_11617 [Hortaea werneckii]